MAIKQTGLAESYKEYLGLISSALLLWGLTALASGAVTTYTTAAFMSANSALKASPAMLAPYILNLLGGVFNLLFGVVLVALGRKIRK